MIRFSATVSEPSERNFGINIGRAANKKIGVAINKFFKDNEKMLLGVFARYALRAIEKLNTLYRGIPVYSGRYISSLLGGWLKYLGATDIMARLKPHGTMAERTHRTTIDWRTYREWLDITNSRTALRRINTGGGLNPNMETIYSFRAYSGTIKPDYWINVEELGWLKTHHYDIDFALHFITEYLAIELKDRLQKMLGEIW